MMTQTSLKPRTILTRFETWLNAEIVKTTTQINTNLTNFDAYIHLMCRIDTLLHVKTELERLMSEEDLK